MDDLANRLSELLESPDGMDTIKALAGQLLGGNDGASAGPPSAPEPAADSGGTGLSSMLSSISPEQIGMMMKIGSALNAQQDDDRSRLLLALKPHLSPMRQKRVDNAIQILKLINILPLLGDVGSLF